MKLRVLGLIVVACLGTASIPAAAVTLPGDPSGVIHVAVYGNSLSTATFHFDVDLGAEKTALYTQEFQEIFFGNGPDSRSLSANPTDLDFGDRFTFEVSIGQAMSVESPGQSQNDPITQAPVPGLLQDPGLPPDPSSTAGSDFTVVNVPSFPSVVTPGPFALPAVPLPASLPMFATSLLAVAWGGVALKRRARPSATPAAERLV